eukprot:2158703-Rhodomonas_salina.1
MSGAKHAFSPVSTAPHVQLSWYRQPHTTRSVLSKRSVLRARDATWWHPSLVLVPDGYDATRAGRMRNHHAQCQYDTTRKGPRGLIHHIGSVPDGYGDMRGGFRVIPDRTFPCRKAHTSNRPEHPEQDRWAHILTSACNISGKSTTQAAS